MGSITAFLIFGLLPAFTTASINITAQSFQVAGEDSVDAAKLTWKLVSDATSYDILQQSAETSDTYNLVTSVPGNSFDIYDITQTGFYQVRAMNGDSELDKSDDVNVTVRNAGSSSYSTYDNTAVSSLRRKSTLVKDGTYYQYSYISDSDGFNHVSEKTSTDGYTFSGDNTVLEQDEVCASVIGGKCKLESIAFVQNPKTEQIVMWAHFENVTGYALGQVAVAYGDPGQNWTFGGTFQPEGDDSRDLSFFADSNGDGYIISAIHTNSDLGLYALNAEWTNVTSKVSTLLAGEKREAPSMIYEDGYYYLFTSTAAGWYPSQGKYISAQDISGPWTASSNIGSVANFGAQSGGVLSIGDFHVMASNRWAGSWKFPESTRQIMLPISTNQGFAAYNFYSTISYDPDTGDVIPIQSGRILSVGKNSTASSTADSSSPGLANDGTQNDPTNLYTPGSVPFWWEVDLGDEHSISQVDVTVKQTAGSEVYLQYNVTGSTDQTTYELLADEMNNTVVGFVTSSVTESSTYRYIRIYADRVINVQNENEADWSAGLYEVTVYGK